MNDGVLPTRKSLTREQWRALLTHPAGWIACGFGSGLFPRAPGTAGSLVALIPWWFALRGLTLPWYIAVLVLAFALGVWACDVSGKRLGVDDHRALVWDEFVGQWIALCAVPLGPARSSWPWMAVFMVAGFLLFRLFDVWKPWPIRIADRRVHGGFGVMLDDVLAGIYALIVMQIATRFL
ncbi:MAG TPA: phosphatidylglycerophosphatase A [Rhodanobacteraceae bacterium]|jgi:phosphatidylglycerophosphatase A|nr:phosphatidylglycerophosphatase A [Rhodanobacteraceae bacterium]